MLRKAAALEKPVRYLRMGQYPCVDLHSESLNAAASRV